MALNNGWIKIETVSGSGDTAVTAEILERNTGRSVTRTATVVGTTAHGAEATAVFTQGPSPMFIIVDHFEDENHDTVVKLDAGGQDVYFIVGYSNVDSLVAVETSEKEYTDMNDEHGIAWSSGILIIDHDGVYHPASGESPIPMEGDIEYGTDYQYTFKIPFETTANESVTDRDVNFSIRNEGAIMVPAKIVQGHN